MAEAERAHSNEILQLVFASLLKRIIRRLGSQSLVNLQKIQIN